jgi:hypothetical protein
MFGVGSRGTIPVASKDLSIVVSLKELTQAFQNRGKKSPFLTVNSPWLFSRKLDSSVK